MPNFVLSSDVDNLIAAADNAAIRTTIGLGTIATQSAANVAITGGSVTGIADLTVSDGGTGSSTPAGARTNLLAVGSDPTGITGATAIANMVKISQADYDAIAVPDPAVMYVIV